MGCWWRWCRRSQTSSGRTVTRYGQSGGGGGAYSKKKYQTNNMQERVILKISQSERLVQVEPLVLLVLRVGTQLLILTREVQLQYKVLV